MRQKHMLYCDKLYQLFLKSAHNSVFTFYINKPSSIYKFKKVAWLPAFVAYFLHDGVRACVWYFLRPCRVRVIHSVRFVQLLRCAHKGRTCLPFRKKYRLNSRLLLRNDGPPICHDYSIQAYSIDDSSAPVWIRWMFVSTQLRAASYTYFGEVLRCPHKRIVTITKVYIATNNIHVEIIRFRKN